MPNYVGNNFWPDAARYGEGVGQALSQALIQRPEDRYRIALQEAQLRNQQQQTAAMNQYRMQGLESRSQQNQMLDWLKQQAIDNTSSYQQGRLGIGQQNADTRQSLAGQGKVEGGFFVPGVGQQNQTNALQQGMGQPHGLPGSIQQLPAPARNMDMTPNQMFERLGQFQNFTAQANSSTNPAVMSQGLQSSNIVQQLIPMVQAYMQKQQGMRMPTNSPAMQGLQKSQTNQMSNGLRQRPDGTWDYIP